MYNGHIHLSVAESLVQSSRVHLHSQLSHLSCLEVLTHLFFIFGLHFFSHATHVVLAVGSFQYPAAQMHADDAVDPTGLEVSTVPHEMHTGMAGSELSFHPPEPQPTASVVQSWFTASTHVPAPQKHSVKPKAARRRSDVHVNASPAPRAMVPGGVVPPYLSP